MSTARIDHQLKKEKKHKKKSKKEKKDKSERKDGILYLDKDKRQWCFRDPATSELCALTRSSNTGFRAEPKHILEDIPKYYTELLLERVLKSSAYKGVIETSAVTPTLMGKDLVIMRYSERQQDIYCCFYDIPANTEDYLNASKTQLQQFSLLTMLANHVAFKDGKLHFLDPNVHTLRLEPLITHLFNAYPENYNVELLQKVEASKVASAPVTVAAASSAKVLATDPELRAENEKLRRENEKLRDELFRSGLENNRLTLRLKLAEDTIKDLEAAKAASATFSPRR